MSFKTLTDRRDMGFKTSTDEQTKFEFQVLDTQFEIWVSRPQQTNRRDLGFKTSTDGHKFQDLDRRTDGIWVSGPGHSI